ncbi:hypothetical protein [Schlesneria paludicola]|uniref:hypothetical protein n=1 Tax=Schlesneria paludicola TaxID=360056 RepID=UPI00029B10F5|nr:hypothetical protein [Schlesneria paludicola]
MKRWGSHLVIALYLSAMSVGIVSQTLKFGNASHPAMYYLIWDMFCGWSAHEIRYHVIGQGESGTYYELAPGPWTRFMPYGDLDRLHYDVLGNSHHKMALNALRRTEHEPIHRIVIVEEVWQKKYNLSDRIWAMRFDEPKDRMSYFWQRAEMDDEGRILSAVPDYLAYLHNNSIASNPQLVAEMHVGKEHYIYNPAHRVHAPE